MEISIYTCLTHPEVEQDYLGECPKCGKALEPITPSDISEAPRTEVGDLARRFWVGLALSLPVFILSLREILGARYFEPLRFYGNYLIQLALSGVVIFWAGRPIFWRSGNLPALRDITKFTLLRMGVLAAWLFSIASVAFFPMLGRHTIEPVPVFFDSAALVTLLALRVQMWMTRLIVKNNNGKPATSGSLAPSAPSSTFRNSLFKIHYSQFPTSYEPLVIGAAVLTFALWLGLGTNPGLMQAPEKAAARALASAVAVLIAASPCALGLAASMSSREGVKHNVLFAFIYGAAIIPIAAALSYPVFGTRLTPMLAGVAMSLSSLIVVLNARRLRRA